jgi:hypothetical protein
MKIKTGFELRTICGEHIIVSHGEENINFVKVISLNESAAYIWNQVIDKDFTVEDVSQLLMDEYDVEETVAKTDAQELLNEWSGAGLVA